MLEKIKNITAYLIDKKDVISTVVGFVGALALAVNDYFISGQKVTGLGLLQAIALFVIAWFTGKKKQ